MPRWLIWPDLPGGIESADAPSWLTRPGLRRYERAALSALWRRDMLSGVWVPRLQRAPSDVVDFANRFHPVPGFHLVMRHHFGGPYRSNLAQIAMRVMARLADRNADFAQRASIEEVTSVLPSGDYLAVPELAYAGVRYQFFPWRRVRSPGLVRLLRSCAVLHARPTSMRWVFAGDRARRGTLVHTMRRMLERNRSRWQRDPAARAWVDDLDKVVRVG